MNVARASILAIVLASPAPAQTAAAVPGRQARRDGVIDASRRIRDPGLTDRVAPPLRRPLPAWGRSRVPLRERHAVLTRAANRG